MRIFFGLTAALLSMTQPVFAEVLERTNSVQNYEGVDIPFEYGNTKVTANPIEGGLELYDAYTKGFIEELMLPTEWAGLPTQFDSISLSMGEDGTRYWGLWGGRMLAIKDNKTLWSVDLNYRGEVAPGSAMPVNHADIQSITDINHDQLIVVINSVNSYPYVNTMIIQKSTGYIMGNLPRSVAIQKDEKYFYLRHRLTVAAYDRKTLAKVWETTPYNHNSWVENNLILEGDYLFTATETRDEKNFIHALDKKTGKPVGKPQKLEKIVWSIFHTTERKRLPNSVSVYTQKYEGCNGYTCSDESRWVYTFSVKK